MTKEELEEISAASNDLYKKQRWVTLEEAHILSNIVEEEAPDHIFESGTANGYSTAWLGLTGIPIITYDIVSRPKVWGDNKPENIIFINDKFSSMVKDAKAVEGKKLFFIDGDHTTPGVLEDTNAVLSTIRPGDVIIFHDLHTSKVVRVWEELKKRTSNWTVYNTQRIIGKLVWEEASNIGKLVLEEASNE